MISVCDGKKTTLLKILEVYPHVEFLKVCFLGGIGSVSRCIKHKISINNRLSAIVFLKKFAAENQHFSPSLRLCCISYLIAHLINPFHEKKFDSPTALGDVWFGNIRPTRI